MQAERIIRKHVAVIHAYALMSSLQRKIFNVLLYEATSNHNCISPDNSVAVECRISCAKLAKAVNFNSKNNQYIKEAIDGLASLKIEWNLLNDKVPKDISFLNLRVLHGAPTFYKDGTFNFSFHKVMLNLVGNPTIYGTIDLDLQAKFESKYAHALYENSTRFIYLQKSKLIQLETYKKLMGVPESKYPSMRELTRNVIMPSLEEVNDRCNFVVTLEDIKVGRKITGYELTVINKDCSRKAERQVNKLESNDIVDEINKNFGQLSEQTLDYILKNNAKEYILEKVEYTKKYTKKENSGYYPIPYFIAAIKNDYKSLETFDMGTKQNNTPNEENDWKIQLNFLQSDLDVYKERLKIFQTKSDVEIINGIKKIIEKCENALQEHLLKRPTKNEAV